MPKSTAPTRSRRRAQAGSSIDNLQSAVDELISENRRLKRELKRLAGRTSNVLPAPLAALQRRVARALGVSSATPVKRTRRKITDPALLQARRDALQRARAVRADKLAAAKASAANG